MIAIGQFDKAEEVQTSGLQMTFDDDWKELSHLHHQLGHVLDEKKAFENALIHYEEALDITLRNPHPD
jgi:tetratricopeptide (TPR) repeat protein